MDITLLLSIIGSLSGGVGITYFFNWRNEKRKAKAEALQVEANAKQTEVSIETTKIENETQYKEFLNSVIADYQRIAEKYKADAEQISVEKDCMKKQLIDANTKVDEMDKSVKELTDQFLSKIDRIAVKVNILKTWIEEVTIDTIDELKIKAKTIDYEKM